MFKFRITTIIALLMFSSLSASGDSFAYLRSLPKAELHLHLGGSFPLDYLLSIATPEQAEELHKGLEVISKKVHYHDVFPLFKLVGNIVNTEERVQMGVGALCRSLKEDGVSYVEIRSSVKDLGKGHVAYLEAILQGMQSERSESFKPYLLLSLQRNSPLAITRTTIDLALKYQEQGVVGIDLSGDSSLEQMEFLISELKRAKNSGLALVLHMGESPKEKGQIDLLTHLEPDRIGHGVFLTDVAKEWIVARKIPLEVCLSSSVLVEMVGSAHEHPGIELYRQGHPIVLCTDDPLLFSTSLSQELLFAHQSCGLTLAELFSITHNSFKYTLGK